MIRFISLLILLINCLLMISCTSDENPPIENEEESINKVTLTFASESAQKKFSWYDADGQGTMPPQIDRIMLTPETLFTLTIAMENTATNTDISAEVEAEGYAHQLFFGFSSGVFSKPSGNGNITDNTAEITYLDQDVNGLPIGLQTQWSTTSAGSGTLRILLKHQPDLKSVSSTSSDGTSDLDITFDIAIE